MTCDDVLDALTEATAPGAPPPPPEVTAHLEACAACRAEADVLRDLAGRVRADLAPGDASAGPAPPAFEAVLARLAPPSRLPGLVARLAALVVAAAAGAALDRAWVREPALPGPSPSVVTDAAPPAAPAATPRDRAREALAANPGGLTAALAALDALSASRGRR